MQRYIAYCELDDFGSYIEESPAIRSFLTELTAQYPQIDDVPEDELDSCPWSVSFDVSDGHVLMPIVWSRSEEMYPIIVELAKKHGLVCVDPQSETIVTAPLGIRRPAKKWWQPWRR